WLGRSLHARWHSCRTSGQGIRNRQSHAARKRPGPPRASAAGREQQRERRPTYEREYKRAWLRRRTPEQKACDAERHRNYKRNRLTAQANYRKHIAAETPAQRAERLRKARHRVRRRPYEMTPAQTKNRLQQRREYYRRSKSRMRAYQR